MDFVVLLVVGSVSAVIVGIICTCLCLAGLRLCCPTKSNVRPSTHEERRETEATASGFEEADDETAFSQYLTVTVHHAIRDTYTAFTNEGPLDRQTEDLYHHVLESTSRHVLKNIEINETHQNLCGTETDTATSEVSDHSDENHYEACSDTDDHLPQAIVSRRGLEGSVASSGLGDATPQASGGGSSSLIPQELNGAPLESFHGGTRDHESCIGNVYQSLGNRETTRGNGPRTSLPKFTSIIEGREVPGSADAEDPDDSNSCHGLDTLIQKAVRNYFNRPVRDILRGDKSPSGININTETPSDIHHAVHDYLTSIINNMSLQRLNEPSTEASTDNKEYVTMQNSVATPRDSPRQCDLSSERKVLVRELPDTSLLASRLSAIRKLPFTFESRKRSFDERNRSLYVNVKGVQKRHLK